MERKSMLKEIMRGLIFAIFVVVNINGTFVALGVVLSLFYGLGLQKDALR